MNSKEPVILRPKQTAFLSQKENQAATFTTANKRNTTELWYLEWECRFNSTDQHTLGEGGHYAQVNTGGPLQTLTTPHKNKPRLTCFPVMETLNWD